MQKIGAGVFAMLLVVTCSTPLLSSGKAEATSGFQTFDLIEVNHVYTTDGRLNFTQLIVWDWSPDYRRYDVQGWVMINRLDEMPLKMGDYWYCQTDRLRARAKLFRETHTQRDPERMQRSYFSERFRRAKIEAIQCFP